MSIKDKILDRASRIFPKMDPRKEKSPVSDKDDSAYLQSPVIDRVKPKPNKPKESGSNTYAKDNQAAIKKLKA